MVIAYRALLIVLFSLMVVGCGPIKRVPKAIGAAVSTVAKAPEEEEAGPPAPVATVTDSLWLVGSENMNQLSGVSRPVVVRIYQLKTKDAFELSNFVDIYQNDEAALGASLVSKTVYAPLYPSERRRVDFELDEQASYVAAFVEYVDFNARNDRAIMTVINGGLPRSLYVQITDNGPQFVHLQ